MRRLISISPPTWGGGVSTTVTVTVDGKATDYSYNNSPIIIKITGGKQYTISFGTIINYKTPSSVSYAAEAGNSRPISLQYKASELIFNVTGLANASDATITVSGNNTQTQTIKHGGKAIVPHDTTISITTTDVEGYKAPTFDSQSYNSNQTIEVAYSEVSVGSMYIAYGEGTMPLCIRSVEDIKAAGQLGSVMDGVFGVGFVSDDLATNYFIPIGHGASKVLDVSNSGYICELHFIEAGDDNSISITGIQDESEAITGQYNTDLIHSTYGSSSQIYDDMFLDVEESIAGAAGNRVTGIPAVNYVKEIENERGRLFGGSYTKASFHVPSAMEIMSFFNNYADYEYIGSLTGNWLDLKAGLPTGYRCNWGGSERVMSEGTIPYCTSTISSDGFSHVAVQTYTDGWNNNEPEIADLTGTPGWTIPMFSVDWSTYNPLQ